MTKVRDVPVAEQLFRVDLHSDHGAAYGYGATMEEAERHAKFFFRRDYRGKKPRATVRQHVVDGHWEVIT